MKRVIITGANGFIGSSLTKKLAADGVEVTAVVKDGGCGVTVDSPLVNYIEVPLNEEAMTASIPGSEYDAFYHLAWAGVNGAEKADVKVQLKNIDMALDCAAAAKKIGCRKFLCAGTVAEQAVKSLPKLEKTSGGMIYAAAKHAAHIMLETYCKSIDMDFVWMQFSNIYGPENKTGNLVSYTLGELTQGREATFGPALQPYDFIFIDDLIEAVSRLGAAENTGSLYFIGSGAPMQLKKYLTEIGEIFGRPELIKTGVRPDDGIVYTLDMFDTEALKNDVGEYVSKTFAQGIRYTIDNY